MAIKCQTVARLSYAYQPQHLWKHVRDELHINLATSAHLRHSLLSLRSISRKSKHALLEAGSVAENSPSQNTLPHKQAVKHDTTLGLLYKVTIDKRHSVNIVI